MLFHRHGSGVRRAAAATDLNIYGSNLEIIISFIVMYVAAAAAARRCRVYGKAPLAAQAVNCNRGGGRVVNTLRIDSSDNDLMWT